MYYKYSSVTVINVSAIFLFVRYIFLCSGKSLEQKSGNIKCHLTFKNSNILLKVSMTLEDETSQEPKFL